MENAPELWAHAWPRLNPSGHKYSRGHCLVWSGPEFATGAARLSSQAALRVGAGLVTLMGEPAALRVHAAHVTAIMLAEARRLPAMLADPRLTACIIGPGAGVSEATRAVTLEMLCKPCVLDADALTSLAGCVPALRAAIIRPTVLTPHEGEFARLFPAMADEPRETKARAAAQATGAVILLKGAETIIAAPDGRSAINRNAPPWLATAGAGDVLAGIIGGLLARDMPAFEAACAGAWLHGEAGRQAGPHLTADDLPAALRAVLTVWSPPLLQSPG